MVSLHFYHGWTQAPIADLLGVSERSGRRWEEALTKLHRHRRQDGGAET